MSPPDTEPTSDHDRVTGLLPFYEIGRLTLEERRIVEGHALTCDACFEELERGAAAARVLHEKKPRFLSILARESSPPAEPGGIMAGLRRAIHGRRGTASRPFRAAAGGFRLAFPALALLALALGVFWHARSTSYRRLAIFPHEDLAVTGLRDGGGGTAVRDLMEAGAAHYNLGRYGEAARRFEAALQRQPDLAEAAYRLGLARIGAGNTDAAIPAFQRAVELSPEDLKPRAAWALANAFVKAGRLEPARRELAALAAGRDGYAARARDLLDRLPR